MVAVNPELMRRVRATKDALRRLGTLRAVYLFGSHVEGRAHEWSDIDVAAFMEEAELWDMWRRAEITADLQAEVGYDIEPHFFSARNLDHPPQGSFAEFIIEHGIRVD